MEYLFSASQMKACDGYTIRELGILSEVLMERAALAVVEEAEAAGFDLSDVLFVCGSGNNGGDGFAAARLLAERRGLHAYAKKGSFGSITVGFVGRDDHMTKETERQRTICEACGIKISTNFMEHEYTAIVDAVFGIGLSRPVEGRYAQVLDWISRQNAPVVAVDIPSGVSADDGQILGTAVRADLTVTFGRRKVGQLLYPGAGCCGRIVCREIGIACGQAEDGAVFTYSEEDLRRIPRRRAYSHKGSYGKVLLVAGSSGMSGAAVLAAGAACRSGCGMVRVFTPECNRTVVQTCLPEALVTTWNEGQDPAGPLEDALAWADTVGIGPGIGTGEEAERILRYVLKHDRKPLVIDADGLNLLAARPGLRKETEADRPVIVTPHVAEMARLAGSDSRRISRDLIGSARDYAAGSGMVCVLKDARTIVSDGRNVYLNTSGNHGMAKAGSGDVLTGVLCSLLAQGMEPFEAAAAGVYLHGRAGDLAREQTGAYGMTAGDLTRAVAEVLRSGSGTQIHVCPGYRCKMASEEMRT